MSGTPYTRNPLMEGFTENYFETKDHVKIHYLHKGEGMPFILIHGGVDDADTWMLNAPAFAEEYSVYVVDLRGNGFSDAHDHGAHIHRLGADIHELIEFIGAPKVNLIGWSMGSSVIWSYIEIFGQDRINKVIFDDEPPMIVANPQFTNEDVLRTGSNPMDFWQIVNTLEKYGSTWSPDEGSPIVDAFYMCFHRGIMAYPPEVAAQIPDGYLEKISQRPEMAPTQKSFNARLMRDHLMLDWTDLFSTITVPVLLLTGDVSIATTPECGKWLADTIPNCKWVRFSAEEYGVHDLCQTAYKKFNREVLDFLRD